MARQLPHGQSESRVRVEACPPPPTGQRRSGEPLGEGGPAAANMNGCGHMVAFTRRNLRSLVEGVIDQELHDLVFRPDLGFDNLSMACSALEAEKAS
jgi:hypothetical protein